MEATDRSHLSVEGRTMIGSSEIYGESETPTDMACVHCERVDGHSKYCAEYVPPLGRCPRCGYHAFNGVECFDCGYRP